ncbi:MAG: DUF262 and DUF1524 domain-containing protein [bacterium]
MKAIESKLFSFLKKSPQFVIPIYQRTYSWTDKECRQLWEDILRTGKNDKITSHFIGSIVYIEKGLYSVTNQEPLLVIDGQQRLTTISIIIECLARYLKESEPVDGFSQKKLREYYLLNSLENGEKRYKVLLTQTDKDTLIAIFDQKPYPKEYSIRVAENYKLFEKWINESNDQIETICHGLAKLIIVDISLSRDQDNPQLIFESLNSTGKELSQADLIRNYILMGLEPHIQVQLYNTYWRPMEIEFGQLAYTSYFDSFMRHYLTFKTGEIPNIREVYEAFKLYSRKPDISELGVESFVSDIKTFAHYFCAMALGAETDTDLKDAFHDLRELKVDVAYPFLLEIYHDKEEGILSKSDFLNIVRLLESYVFRRSVCAIPTNSMNKTFATITRLIKKESYVESIQAYFLLLPSYRRFPNDDEFKRNFQTKDIYNFRNKSYWLRRMENSNRKERIVVSEYTIEHIMPQNNVVSEAWKADLGNDWEGIHKTLLHTLGNLTLTGYNPEYSDNSFQFKRDLVPGGFKESPLRLNKGLADIPKWDESAIKDRANRLSEDSLTIWESPKLDDSVLENYKPKKEGTGYDINQFPFLQSEPLKILFEEFRREVLAINPCVVEDFLKLYVAYKAETNFVDIIPQSKRLRLTLNMAFHEIYDPKGLCKDVSSLGRWGNGDVEVILSNLDQLPYVLSLVRQSFDKQMNNGEVF